MYPFSNEAVYYTVNNLFEFAGITLKEDFKMTFNRDAYYVTVTAWENKPVILKIMQQNDINQLLKGQLPLQFIPSFDLKESIPFFITNNEKDFATISDEELVIHADIVTIPFIMLSRYEETLIVERDQHNRFEYKSSLASRYGFIDIPIVDEYAMLFRVWLSKYVPGINVYERIGKIVPTHDIDLIRRFGNLFRNIQTILGGDLIARKSLSIALNSLKQCVRTVIDSKKDPLIVAILKLIGISKVSGLCSNFYFKGLKKGQNNCTYDVFIPEVKYCMEKIKEEGMVVGIHGGLDSYDNEFIYKQEKKNIESVYGSVVTTNRQHFLKFDINKTLHVWQDCNVQIDSTLGYAEREGFRCGTCHEYHLFDLKNDCISTVKERPLIVMDVTLFEYRGLNIEAALSNMEKLYERCKAVGGEFVILWHNENLFRDYINRFEQVYCRFLEKYT